MAKTTNHLISMIKFFRKIRQKLIKENRFSKYLLYAIGEIILVVIGILIALSINNWNQERIEIVKLNGNLSYLLEDIDQNRLQLENLKKVRKEVLASCTDIINTYKQSQVISNELWNESFFEIVIERQFRGNLNGFEKTESSEIYESESLKFVRKLVVEYYEMINQLNYTESKLNVTIEEIERELFRNGFQDEIWDYVRVAFMKTYKKEKSDRNIDALEVINKYPEIKGILLRYEVDVPIILRQYDTVIKKGEELKVVVKDYLSHN